MHADWTPSCDASQSIAIAPEALGVAGGDRGVAVGVADDDVYEAIFWHTTGRPNWNNVGLALYVADFSEPLRKIPEAVEARKRLQERGFAETVRYVTAQKQAYVARKFSLDPVTKAFGRWVESEFTP